MAKSASATNVSPAKVPENLREVHDMAWALANGMREVMELERRAASLVGGLKRAAKKVEKGEYSYVEAYGPDSHVDHYRERLEEIVGDGEW